MSMISDILQKKIILEVPNIYLQKFKPEKEVTDLVKFQINIQVKKTIINLICMLFNKSNKNKYDFNLSPQENLAAN